VNLPIVPASISAKVASLFLAAGRDLFFCIVNNCLDDSGDNTRNQFVADLD
jgi:hypothetical protein